jgi:hypothetical protein
MVKRSWRRPRRIPEGTRVPASAAITAASFSSQIPGRYIVLSPHELEQHGTRWFPLPVEIAVEVCATALAMLGYFVNEKNPVAGIVRTAPREGDTFALGGPGNANLSCDELSWSLHIVPVPDGVTIYATPHAHRNRARMVECNFLAEAMTASFVELWREIEEVIIDISNAGPGVRHPHAGSRR